MSTDANSNSDPWGSALVGLHNALHTSSASRSTASTEPLSTSSASRATESTDALTRWANAVASRVGDQIEDGECIVERGGHSSQLRLQPLIIEAFKPNRNYSHNKGTPHAIHGASYLDVLALVSECFERLQDRSIRRLTDKLPAAFRRESFQFIVDSWDGCKHPLSFAILFYVDARARRACRGTRRYPVH